MPSDGSPKVRSQDSRSSALFSDDGIYRYRLSRTWNVKRPTLAFVMLNPSTADATTNDPTVRRCLGYAEDWGYGKRLVGNIFALRSPDPEQLYGHPDPVGPDNDTHLQAIADNAERTIVAWGAQGDLHRRGREVTTLLGDDLHALDTTREGHPTHPLYQPKDIESEVFEYG